MIKKALLLDSVDRGTIQTVLQTNGYYRHTKLLKSSLKNWESICDLIESENASNNDLIIIGKLTEHTLFRMCLPDYEEVVERLIKLLQKNKHILFIFKDNMFGNFTHFTNIDKEIDLPQIDDDLEFKVKYKSYYINYVSS